MPEAPKPPASPEAPTKATHVIPEDALTQRERELLFKGRDPVDADAALAWLNGEGPDPWQSGESS